MPAVVVASWGARLVSRSTGGIARGHRRGDLLRRLTQVTWDGHNDTPAIGDIDADGVPEIFVATGSNTQRSLLLQQRRHDPVVVSEQRLTGVYNNTVLADVDGDGQSEIIHETHIINNDGTLPQRRSMWAWAGQSRSSEPRVGRPGSGRRAGDRDRGEGAYDLERQPAVAVDVRPVSGRPALSDTAVSWMEARPRSSSTPGLAMGNSWTAVANIDTDPYPEVIVVSTASCHLLTLDLRARRPDPRGAATSCMTS